MEGPHVEFLELGDLTPTRNELDYRFVFVHVCLLYVHVCLFYVYVCLFLWLFCLLNQMEGPHVEFLELGDLTPTRNELDYRFVFVHVCLLYVHVCLDLLILISWNVVYYV